MYYVYIISVCWYHDDGVDDDDDGDDDDEVWHCAAVVR